MGNENPEDHLETLSEAGNPPMTRLNSATSAYKIVSNLIRRDGVRDKKRATIQGQIDGNQPYADAALKRTGQGHRSNVNFRSAEGIRDSRKTSYYELLMEVETLVEIDVRDFKDELNETPVVDYGEIIAEEFTTMLTDWPGFWYHTMLHQEQIVTWGIGNCYWENMTDWRFKSVRIGAFLVPDKTKALLESFDLCGIRDEYLVHELFERVKDEKTEEVSRAAGWNVPLIKKAIRQAADKTAWKDEFSIGEWASLQTKIKANDLEYSFGDKEAVPVTHLLYKEFDGKISHMIVVEDSEVNNVETSPDKQENWLFRSIGEFPLWENVLCLFFAGIGEGTYHSIRGLGAKIFAHCVINDRLLNSTVDGAIASATILLQPSNDPQKERIRLVRVGPFSVMPAGYQVIPHGSFNPNLDGLIGVHNLLAANLNRNVGLYRPDVIQEEKTPQGQNQAELRNRATKEAKLEKSDINLYYIQWDRLFQETLRRALNSSLTKVDPGGEAAKAFIDRCIKRDVPRKVLTQKHLAVSARRAIGVGSPVMRSLVSADILSISPYFDEKGKKNAVRDYVSSRAGQRAVKRYIPATDRNQIPTNASSLAALENNDLREGQSCVVGVDQPHVIHLLTHVQPLVEMAQAYTEGQVEPQVVNVYMQTALPHIAQHLDFIVNDPSRVNEYKAFMETFTELAKIAATIEQQVRAIEKEQLKQEEDNAAVVAEAQAQTQDGELQAKLAKVAGDLQLRVLKEQGNQRVRETKALHGMQIDEMLAKHKITLENAKAAGERE